MSKGEEADDFMGAEAAILDLIVNESDKRIAAQLQLLMAGDLRASGILAATATLAAAGFTVAGQQLGKDGNPQLLAGATAFAVFSSLATVQALWALWPTGVEVQGWSPCLFVDDVSAKKDLLRMKAEIAALNQQKIDGNDHCSKVLASRIRLAMACLAVAPIVGALVLWISNAILGLGH